MTNTMYNDPCTIALQYDQRLLELLDCDDKLFIQIDEMYRETLCVEEQLSNQEYLDKIDSKLYKRSHGY
jgi:hypothetical protein